MIKDPVFKIYKTTNNPEFKKKVPRSTYKYGICKIYEKGNKI